MLLILIVIILLIAVVPAWPYSRGWGYYPSGGLGLLTYRGLAMTKNLHTRLKKSEVAWVLARQALIFQNGVS